MPAAELDLGWIASAVAAFGFSVGWYDRLVTRVNLG